MKIYFYPPNFPSSRNITVNPYAENFINALRQYSFVINAEKDAKSSVFDLLLHSLLADAYIINWAENIAYKPYASFQYFIFKVALSIIKLRKRKLVWIFHNIYPHCGENMLSKKIMNSMYKKSDLVISHSVDGLNYLKDKEVKNTIFLHHPFYLFDFPIKNIEKTIDILIWGSIEPYKGVLEFLKFFNQTPSKLKLKIVGKCRRSDYWAEIKKYRSKYITIENRVVGFEELSELIQSSRFILFPYLSGSISSSGALMDSLALGGTVIGPNKGAFKDLAKNNICKVYNSFEEINETLLNNNSIDIINVSNFISENTWDLFAEKIIRKLKDIT